MIDRQLPEQGSYVVGYAALIHNYIEIPDNMADLLIHFLYQNNGQLSKRARNKEFVALKDDEVEVLENKFAKIFQ